MTLNHEDRLIAAEEKCRTMMAPLMGIPGVKIESITNVIGHQPYGVNIYIDSAVTGMTNHDLVARLKAGDPPVWTRIREGEECITLHAFGLYPGEDEIVGQRIADLFGR